MHTDYFRARIYYDVLAYLRDLPKQPPSPYLPRSQAIFMPRMVGLLAFPRGKHNSNSPTRNPTHARSWPLHGFFFLFNTAILIVILLRLITFNHHWHHIRARRIWLADKVGPYAVFADMRSFISSLLVPEVA